MTVPDDLTRLALREASRLVHEGKVSPVELTEACLARIDELEGTLNAFITVTAEAAVAAAREAERELASGRDRGPLHGIPIALKDLFETAGLRTTAGSKIRLHAVPERDAAAVARLAAAGAISVGKTNLHEWALGVTNDNPHFGATANPWATERIPGGSSGGSAAALVAGYCYGALGSDTGGSIRIPASLCGIAGLKPTYGRVSLRGVVPLSWSLDHAGPMAREVAGLAMLLQVIAGYDAGDPASQDVPVDDYTGQLEAGLAGLHLAVPTEYFFDDLHTEVAAAVADAIALMRGLGATITPVRVPRIAEFNATQSPILLTEAATYHREDLRLRAKDIGADVLARLRRGEPIAGMDYAQARRTQAELRRGLIDLLKEHHAIVTPTTRIAAPLRAGEDAVAAAAKLTALTLPFSLTGLPAVSIPCGFTPDGLPIGLQIVGAPWAEALVLRVAAAYERATEWHRRTPPLLTTARAS